MQKGRVITICVVGALAFDQATKLLLQNNSPLNNSFVAHSTYKNSGLAFSVFSQSPSIALLLSLIALVCVVGSMMMGKRGMGVILPLSIIAGAGLSNVLDRLAYGYVRDPFFIYDLYFNVADVLIMISIVWLGWVVLTGKKTQKDSHHL